VLDELRNHGHVIDPKVAKEEKDKLPGTSTLDNEFELVLLALRKQDPHRSFQSYKYNLQVNTGTMVSKKVLSQWFQFIIVAMLDTKMLLLDKRRSTRQILIRLAIALVQQDIPPLPISFFERFN
jgi:hypothetical protein